ncbi:MAG: AMP-binding protein [Vulcanibacillus sp.]
MNLLDDTIGGFLDKISSLYPEKEALVSNEREVRLNYREFNRLCRKVAKGFMAMGIKKGDHIAIWATNYPEWVLTQFATAKMGAVLVTVNTNYKIFELEYLLRQSDSGTLILTKGFKDSDYVSIINQLCPEIKDSQPGKLKSEAFPFLKNLIYLDDDTPKGMFNWKHILEASEDITDYELDQRQAELDKHDVINMQYTSGTTGFPKGVMLTHYNILNNGKSIGDNMKLTEKDILLIHVPLFHCFGCVLATMACVTHGTTMVLLDHFNPVKAMQTIQQEKCTGVHGVPTMFIAMLEHEDIKKYNFSSLRTGIMAGSPCPIKTMRQTVEVMGMDEVTIVYGQTEASPGCTMTTTEDSLDLRVSTVGSVLPFIEAKIIDYETGEDLPPNTNGEFVVRGYNLMKGYYKMPEATAQAIDSEGWLHTGDIATMDENGYYKITGRIKDMIIRGGENIYPKEIEECLRTNDLIRDVQVIGVPSQVYGEEIMACIIPKENFEVSEKDIKEFVLERMARHKVPKYVWFMEEFPMTASGKIKKFELKDMAIEKFNLQDAASIETA